MMIACETVYSGDTVVLVFPDGTGPALLSCMIAGIPYNRVHELELQPGEVRSNVTLDTTWQLLQERQENPERREAYNARIEQGRKELSRLRSIDFVQQQTDQMESDARDTSAVVRPRAEANAKANAKGAGLGSSSSSERIQGDGAVAPSSILGSVGLLGAAGALLLSTTRADGEVNTDDARRDADNRGTRQANTAAGEDDDDDDERTASQSSSPVVSIRSTATMASKRDNTEASETNVAGVIVESSSTDTADASSETRQKERADAAEKAMQDYLDTDDGGNAWLESLSGIIEDANDDDDDAVSDPENTDQDSKDETVHNSFQ